MNLNDLNPLNFKKPEIMGLQEWREYSLQAKDRAMGLQGAQFKILGSQQEITLGPGIYVINGVTNLQYNDIYGVDWNLQEGSTFSVSGEITLKNAGGAVDTNINYYPNPAGTLIGVPLYKQLSVGNEPIKVPFVCAGTITWKTQATLAYVRTINIEGPYNFVDAWVIPPGDILNFNVRAFL